MNTSPILNVITTQYHRCYINVPRNVSPILNVLTTSTFLVNWIAVMNVSPILNVLTTQLGTSCSFDSPGLARNEPTPGKHSQGDSTP